MSYKTFNNGTHDATKEPMFFGNSVNIARYDVQKYRVFEKLTEKQLSFFWRPEEVDVSKDSKDFASLPDHEQHIFISNLKYQILLDSVQGRSPNVAFLPIVSLPELETWIETWSFSECLAEGTEVLTQDGWKDLADTTTDDQCLVYDLTNEDVFFEKPKRVVEYDIDTDMVRYFSSNPKQFEQLVTPNHRMPVVHRDVRKDGTKQRYFKEAILQDYKAHHLAPISGHVRNSKNYGLSPVERILIAVQADGSVSNRYTGQRCGTVPVWFNLTKKRKIERLLDLCKKASVQVDILSDDNRDNSKRFKINIPAELLTTYKNFKTFDWVDLKSSSLQFCQEFMEELSEWDSHKHSTASFTYSTTVKENADVVQAIASMCGKSPRLKVIRDGRKDSYLDVYSINLIDKAFKDGQSIKKEYVKYKGKVRCLETSTGAFVIRYNGVVSVTGNTIHSRSYTHILRNLFSDPSVVFDNIVNIDEIAARAESVTGYYDHLIRLTALHHTGVEVSKKDLMKALYLTLVSVNVLEGVRFYVSFACSFAFAERKLMEGNAKIIKLIARDEALHLTGTQQLLNLIQSGREGTEFAEVAKECRQEAIDIFVDAAKQEKEWAEYLFKDGSMLGLNASILGTYVEHITDARMQAVGFESPFKGTTNPLPWMSNWLVSSNVQVAPQETEISSYLVGQIDSAVTAEDLSSFTL